MQAMSSTIDPSAAAARRAVPAPVLEARDLHLSFGAIKALVGVNFHVSAGELVSIIGPNGAGKSSLLNCLSGFYTPSTGSIRFLGEEIGKLAAAASRRARHGAHVPGHPDLRVDDGAREHPVRLPLPHAHRAARRRCSGGGRAGARWCDSSTRPRTSSSFSSSRNCATRASAISATACASASTSAARWRSSPKMLILDEPMAGMNADEKADLARYILDISDGRDVPVVLVEHDMEVVMDISDRVMVLEWGRMIAEGTPGRGARRPEGRSRPIWGRNDASAAAGGHGDDPRERRRPHAAADCCATARASTATRLACAPSGTASGRRHRGRERSQGRGAGAGDDGARAQARRRASP